MTTIRKYAGLSLLLTLVVLLSACRPTAAPAEPTPDADMIRTAAVETVAAELTEQARLNPTATATDIPTPEPTPTSAIPTLVPLGMETQTNNGSGDAPQQVATQAPPPAGVLADKADWIANVPADGAAVQPGQKFEVRWTVRNSGTTTWNTNYKVRFFSGNISTPKSEYSFRAETKPGAVAEIVIEAVAPSEPGEYFTWWKLTNEQGANFADVDLAIKVEGKLPTATPSP
jgi:hypothetical protein